jgi:hypothetical protein
MTFESTTTDTDQGVGKVWFNHGTLASATVLYMDDVDANSASINSWVDSWDDSTTTALRGTVKVVQQADPAIFALYNVTGAVTSATTYSKIPVSYVTGAGSFSNTDASSVSFFRTGNTGSAGSNTPSDAAFRIQDNSDATKQIAFEASGISTSTTRTVTMPDSDVTLAAGTQLANVSEDTSPQLGGNLDLNGNIISGVPAYAVSVGNTANTNSSQGDNPITTYFYEIATCANAGDAVTLPTATAGKVVVVSNNGAEDADVFPATGDNIDAAGVNTAYSLESGTNVMFIAQDATDWDTISGGGGGNKTTEGLYEHAHTISANYVITTNNNALTAGPITIDTGVSVTVPTGSTWVIA